MQANVPVQSVEGKFRAAVADVRAFRASAVIKESSAAALYFRRHRIWEHIEIAINFTIECFEQKVCRKMRLEPDI
jgi:hypothetical protein